MQINNNNIEQIFYKDNNINPMWEEIKPLVDLDNCNRKKMLTDN